MTRRVITASEIDEIRRCYGQERTGTLAKRLGLHKNTVVNVAREEGIVLTARQQWRTRSPYSQGMRR